MQLFEEWLDLFKQGNRSVLEKIYASEFIKFKNYANRFSEPNPEILFDIFQDALTITWEKCVNGTFLPKNKSEFEAFLFTISRNQYISLKKKIGKEKLFIAEDFYSEEIEESKNYTEIVLESLKMLGNKCKEIIQLYYLEGNSLQEIAKQLHHSEDSIKTMKFRCISKLKELVKNKL